MTDIKIIYDNENQFGDILVDCNDLVRHEGLESAVLISLFTDRRVDNTGGYLFESVTGITYGSRLFTLDRTKATIETVMLIELYAKEALQWMIEDGVASEVQVNASLIDRSRIDLVVKVLRGDETLFDARYSDLWNSQFNPPDFCGAVTVDNPSPPVDVSQWYNYVGIPDNATAAASSRFSAVGFGDGMFMMIPDTLAGAFAVTTTDGVTTTERGLMTSSRVIDPDIAYGNGIWVVTSTLDDKTLASSDQGATWQTGNISAECRAVAFGAGIFLVLEIDGREYYTSTDGVSWTQRALPSVGGATTWSVLFADGAFVILSTTHSFVSSDGVAWVSTALSVSGDVGVKIGYSNGIFVGGSDLPSQTIISEDGGFTWSAIAQDLVDAWMYVGGDGKFVGVSAASTKIWTSTDAENWDIYDISWGSNNESPRRMAYGEINGVKMFVGVSEAGDYHLISNIPPDPA